MIESIIKTEKKILSILEKDYVFLFLVFVICMPFFFTIIYSYPAQDDFLVFNQLKNAGNSLFRAIFVQYMKNAGGLFYILMEFVLNPLNYFEASSWFVGIYLEILFTIFVVSGYYYFKFIISEVFEYKRISVIRAIYLLILFCLLNERVYSQVFYWYVGSIYMIAFLMLFLIHALTIVMFRKKNTWVVRTLCSVAGFLGCSTYVICMPVGVFYLNELWNLKSRRKEKITIKHLSPLLFMVIGGILGFLAPGNFVRLKSEGGDCPKTNSLTSSC